jgi:hypothetical protein
MNAFGKEFPRPKIRYQGKYKDKKIDNRLVANLQQKKMTGKYCKRVVEWINKLSQ